MNRPSYALVVIVSIMSPLAGYLAAPVAGFQGTRAGPQAARFSCAAVLGSGMMKHKDER